MKNFFLIISLLLSSQVSLSAQEIVSLEATSTIEKVVGDLLLLTLGVNLQLDTGVDVLRVTYTTTGSDGMPDTASGLFMMPMEFDGAIPMMIYQHGTTDGRDDVPSNLAGGYQLGGIFAGKGIAVAAPDFLGMGTSRGFHPYVDARTEATAGVDLLRALRVYLEEQEIEWNKQLFLTGYSQGGHAAMAAHKYIQEELPDEFTVTASLPMSGPYSISGVMKETAFQAETYGFPAYLVYSTLGAKQVNPDLYEDESEVFREEFLADIAIFKASGNGLFDLNEALITTLVATYGNATPRLLFKDSLFQILNTQEDHPFNQALRDSDLFDWRPEAPVFMLYCQTDDQVPFRNSVIADSIMNLNGAPNVDAMDESGGRNLDHSDCIVPALNTGVPWLLGFIDESTSTYNLALDGDVLAYPNPSTDWLFIESSKRINQIELFGINGQRLQVHQTDTEFFKIDTRQLTSGLYMLHVFTEEGLNVQKIVVP